MTLPFAAGNKLTAASLNAIFGEILSGSWMQQTFLATAQTTTSVTTYADLATAGPTVTVTSTGTLALVFISAFITASAAHNAQASVAVSGATTLTALLNANGLLVLNAASTGIVSSSMDLLNINAGTNTYKMQYTNSGTQTGTFADRQIIVFAP